MATADQLRLLPIKSEDRFEQFCLDLWREIWNDPAAARHGRRGQAQQGVDVYGVPHNADRHYGVQCKAYEDPLTDAQIQHEIDEAKKFRPHLEMLIIATTAPRDAKGQKYIRTVDLQHKKQGLFRVQLLGWEDIVDLIQKCFVTNRPDLVEYYFSLTSSASEFRSVIRDELQALASSPTSLFSINGQGSLPVDDTLSRDYHADLDYAKRLVNSFEPYQALKYLEDLQTRIWAMAPAPVRFRILHYMGFAHYQLSDNEKAGKLFVEALQFDPQSEVALTFAALGFMLLEEYADALRVSTEALSKNPVSTKAHAVRMAASPLSVSLHELVVRVPQSLRDDPEIANGLAQAARRRDDLIEAERWIRVAAKSDQPSTIEFKATLGEILLARATTGLMVSPTVFQLTQERLAMIAEADANFTAAWEGLAGSELQASRWQWLVNRSLARLLMGNVAESIVDLDELLRQQPTNRDFAYRRAEIAVQIGDYDVVPRLLERISPPTDDHEILMSAQLFLSADHATMSLDVLQTLFDRAMEDSVALDAHRLAFEAAIDLKDLPLAEHHYELICVKDPESAKTLIEGYRLSKLRGDEEAVADFLDRTATAVVLLDASPILLAGIASELFEAGRHEQAATLYERIADRTSNNPVTRSLLRCYYDAGFLDKALGLALSLLTHHGPLPLVSEIAAAIYEEAGDPQEARKIAQEYLNKYPGDVAMKLRLAFISVRLGDVGLVDSILFDIGKIGDLHPEQASRVARLHAFRGRALEALRVAYELRRSHPDRPDTHLLLVEILLHAKPEGDEDLLLPERVDIDTAVMYGAHGEPDEWIIIEERNGSRLPNEEPPNGPLAARLIGHMAGDEVIIGSGPASERVFVRAVASKYVRAAQESMRTFQRQFPESRAMWRFKVGTDAGQPSMGDFQPLFDMLDRQNELRLQVETAYRAGHLSVGAVASLLRCDVLAVWSRFISDPTLGIRCTGGSQNEFDEAQTLARTDLKLVLEPVSLMTLYGLEVKDTIAAAFGPFAIPQSLLDWLNQLIRDLENKQSESYMTIVKDGKQYVRQEITPDDVQHQLQFVRTILAWTQENCDVMVVEAALTRRRSYRTMLENLMHPAFVDAMLLASEDGRLLYTDDVALRLLSASELGTQGVWTQVLLSVATENGKLTKDQYAQCSILLATSNYRHTHISPDIVLVAAEKAKWLPVSPFTNVIQVLSGTMSDPQSAVSVACEVIYGIWVKPLMDHQKSFLTQAVLDLLCSGRNPFAIIPVLRAQIANRFRLHPIGLKQVYHELSAWTVGHGY